MSKRGGNDPKVIAWLESKEGERPGRRTLMTDSEWEGEPHTLTVHSVTPPAGQFDDGSLEYDIKHPPSCKQEQVVWDNEPRYLVWTCDVAHSESEIGLASALGYSGTPVTEPGTYRIRSWGRKYYVWDAAAYEYDGGVGIMTEEDGTDVT